LKVQLDELAHSQSDRACDKISDKAGTKDQKDLQGAGLSRIECVDPLPLKTSFWVFTQLADQKKTGEVRLAIMRADSGRRYFFRPVRIRHNDAIHATIFCIRLYDCVFPERGVYFIELWYDGNWIIDQRLEVV
jgi:hypothetical protein